MVIVDDFVVAGTGEWTEKDKQVGNDKATFMWTEVSLAEQNQKIWNNIIFSLRGQYSSILINYYHHYYCLLT